jgi:hypothetical protein
MYIARELAEDRNDSNASASERKNAFAGDWTIGWELKASRTGREQPHNKHASVSIAATRVSGFGDVERDR